MFSQGFEVEMWFKAAMRQLKMTDKNPPTLAEIKKVLLQRLRAKSDKALRHLKDIDDAEEWLDLALKCDQLISLENESGEKIRIAVDVTSNPEQIKYKFDLIDSHAFHLARMDLRIQKHWIVLVNPNCLPEKDRIVDVFYELVDRVSTTEIIKL